jgi:hypothetical protein
MKTLDQIQVAMCNAASRDAAENLLWDWMKKGLLSRSVWKQVSSWWFDER